MSEEATEIKTKGKGKGKMPIIIAGLVVLVAGGFFGMKMRGGSAKKPELALAKTKSADLKPFLVNLRDKDRFAQVELSLQTDQNAKPTLIEDHMSAIRDAVNMRLGNLWAKDYSPENLPTLKRELATDINKALAAEPSEEGAVKADAAAKPDAKKDVAAKLASSQPAAIIHKDWDSDTGPILKIYILSLAVQ